MEVVEELAVRKEVYGNVSEEASTNSSVNIDLASEDLTHLI